METSNIRSILLSSTITQTDIEMAFEAGVNHFLRKPIKEGELVNIIYQLEREERNQNSEKILIVDDSPGARMVIEKELSPSWPNLFTAMNGAEGVRMAKDLKPDIITMDMEMPLMDGLEACRRLKEDPETENIPVVFITANNSHEFRGKGFDAGAAEYFTKPFQPRKLADFFKILMESKNIRRPEKILIVEDSRTTRHILKYFFIKNGYTVMTVEDGEDALDLVRRTLPDLVITDCRMPKMDGFELTRRLKSDEKLRRIPVLFLTGQSDRVDLLKGFSVGAVDFVLKPFDEAELMARVDTHLRNKTLMEQMEREKEKLRIVNEEKDKFLGIAAHDLRNPLSSIIGFTTILMEDNLDGETRTRFMNFVKESSEGMLKLLEDLVDISKIERGKVSLMSERGNLSRVIAYRVSLADVIARKKGITIHFSTAGDTSQGGGP